MASIFQRGQIWWIQYYENGKQIHRSLKTKDKAVARFKKNEIENKISAGDTPLNQANISVKECLDSFKTYREGRIKDKTKTTDYYRIELFIKEEKIYLLKDVKEDILKTHLDKRLRAGLSHRTANHTIRILKTFLNYCVKQKYISVNPIKDMPKYPVTTEEPRFLTHTEIDKILKIAQPYEIYNLIIAGLYTGMRLGELERLNWEDIDFKDDMITVRLSKSKKFRKIPLHSELKAALIKNKSTGKCFNTNGFYWQLFHLRKKLDRAGIKRFRFHDLRHTFASMLIKSGADILTVSKLLGHSSVVVTQIYAHLYQDHIKDAIKNLKI